MMYRVGYDIVQEKMHREGYNALNSITWIQTLGGINVDKLQISYRSQRLTRPGHAQAGGQCVDRGLQCDNHSKEKYIF